MSRVRAHRFFFAILVATLAAGACKQEGTVTVHKLTFKGVKSVDESRLSSALATRESSHLPWGKKYSFVRSRFDADLKRVQAFYADRGFPDARVTSFDAKLNDKQDRVDITVSIDEGEPIRVAAIDFVGFDVLPPARLSYLMSRTPLKIGQPRDRQLVVTTHEMALNELKDHGYPYAKVTTDESAMGNPKQVKLTLTAAPGPIADFGPIEITGNRSVSNRVIERELTYKPGDVYRRSLVQDSQRRLYGLELFQFVNIESLTGEPTAVAPTRSDGGAGPDEGRGPGEGPESEDETTAAAPGDGTDPPGQVPTRVTVAEGKHQRVHFGVGYGTEERARVDAEYHHLNFLGDARSAGAHVRYSSLDRGVRAEINQPYFFAPHFLLRGEGQQWYTFTPSYSSVVQGGKATLTHRTNEKSSWSVSLTGEHDSSSVAHSALSDPSTYNALIGLGLNPITGEQNGTLNSIGFDVQQSTADNLLDSHQGYQVAVHAEQAGQILPGSFKYTAISGDARHYLPIRDNVTLASRVQFGNLRPAANQQPNVPFSKLFFLGGATSVRGWGRYEISPLSPSGMPIGGDSMFAFSEELRAPLRGKFDGVLFLDAGNVWANSWGVRLNNLRYAVGTGLRYQTPVGPIRLDFGYQLNPEPGLTVDGSPQTRRWRVHFSIGQAF
jgi:outer membrane protein insertion porin family/translocation and assembly module TamA